MWEIEKRKVSLPLESYTVSFYSGTAAARMVNWGQLIIYSMLARTNQ